MQRITWLAVKWLAFHGGLLYFIECVCQAIGVDNRVPTVFYAFHLFCMLATCLLLFILLGMILWIVINAFSLLRIWL